MLPTPLDRLITALKTLPGIGPKSAERMAFYLLKQPASSIKDLSDAVVGIKVGMTRCERCFLTSQKSPCEICSDPHRDQQILCVVEEPMDVFALEKTGAYKGLYHVLHGAISPLDQVTAEDLTIRQLLKRLEKESISEVILATNPTVTGEATAAYLRRELQGRIQAMSANSGPAPGIELDPTAAKPRSLRITHLAQGLPMGGQLEFADQDTLERAIRGRREEA